jgi:hypothetical protein
LGEAVSLLVPEEAVFALAFVLGGGAVARKAALETINFSPNCPHRILLSREAEEHRQDHGHSQRQID